MIKITGASGFVGNNLTNYFTRFKLSFSKLTRSDLDQISSIDLNDCNTIIHLAGKAHDLRADTNAEAYYEVNYKKTKQLYDAFLNSTAEKFIFISSVKAVADTVNGVLLEDVVPNPITDYGKSKLMAEHYIQSCPLPLGKSYFILRPCMIHGPGNKGNLNLLYKFIQKGIPYPLASFENKRSFLSVDNLCFVIKELITGDVPFGVYNVADDESLSTKEVIGILAKSMGKKELLWNIPVKIVVLLVKIGDLLKLQINSERLQKLTENYVVSNQKIKTILHKELPLNVREGLMKTAKSFTS